MAAPTYDNVSIDPTIARAATYGPSYSTLVMVTASGSEQRVAQWSIGRYKGSITKEALDLTATAVLLAFFHGRMGKARPFRFKDWSDYTVTNEPLAPTGVPTVQLIKTYTSGPISFVRSIYAPVLSPAVTLRKNGSAFAGYVLDTTTGLVTLNAISSVGITGISAANPAVLTVVSHPFAVNDLLYITGVAGMTAINTLVGRVTAFTGTTITTTINALGFSPWTSGGTATKYLASTDSLDWLGAFDNVVRFDTDDMPLTQDDVTYRSWAGIPLIEVR